MMELITVINIEHDSEKWKKKIHELIPVFSMIVFSVFRVLMK